ncbi:MULTISPECIES: prephenate dehydratase [Burkholderia]|uniref:Bifunctional chorismate mutase/prephenate dehydratase n=2 Tax=Burkholderia gladioli TaxID=28095 RepID=A0A2A7S6S8_BURGA|nr:MULTISPECIES: prephenate dehydratase [Burkholderia]ATF85152.1 chorismate mutase [Burkholderia gladioli pv. gladioli]MBJ9664261.1 prephenate dehydratase [Burkholderia gladioli]MBJ9713421.1 prephenate dehydratase [Burkholderia gladioli]MBU9159246.1 prephenate dehydratase [Burkholderia gladioli]MBU9171497.1 prephenate dehydratase [Burkholderia gladioli]
MDDELNSRLKPLRERIDAIDTQLIALLNQRAAVALEVGEVKKEFKAPVFRPEREQQVIARLQEMSEGPLVGEHINAIWREIMAASRSLEKTIRVSFLGPIGTYSEQAMFEYFGQSIEGLPCPSIDEVFRGVEAGASEFGIVPVENSAEGAVSRTLDLLLHTQLLIGGELSLPIHHNLLSQSGSLDGVKRVCAHAQSLAQCQRWLAANAPHLERQAVASNAEAARLAADDPSVAAIAGDRAAIHYGLQIAYSMIQDDPHNRTRFVTIGRAPTGPSGCDQTSLIVSVKNEPGAVFKLLEPLARHGVSMTRFESRPARVGTWEYYFYIDIEGHRDDASVAAALTELGGKAAFLKILGSYPRAR